MASVRAHVMHQANKIRTIARKRFSFRVKWLAKFGLGKLKHTISFGLNGLDLKMVSSINLAPSYYIEIGANNGVSQSNTLVLELFYGWRGLLIEPTETAFQQLQRNRSKRRNFLLRSACVSSAFSHSTVDIVYSNLMSVAVGLESDVKDPFSHAEKGKQFLLPEQEIRVESVPAMTLTRALETAKAPDKIGLLSLDVEGAEIEVLKGVDFDKYQIDWILVECREIHAMTEFLSQRGYTLTRQLSSHDYLFRLK